MQSFSETESEPEQFPMDPVVEEQSLEKPKRKRKAKAEPVGDKPDPVVPEKPKRVMSEEHKEKMRIAREKAKERRLSEMQKPETELPKAEEPKAEEDEPKPKRKYVRKTKAVEEPKEKVVEVHHHHYEEKPKKTRSKSEPKPKKTRAKKEATEPKPVVPSVDFV